jgi:hypothetical protein
MYPSQLKKIMVLAAAIPLLASGHAATDHDELREQAAHTTNTGSKPVKIQAQTPKIDPDGTATFVIDLSRKSIFELIALARSDRTLVVFRGDPKDPENLCPYFDLATRPFDVRHIAPVQPVYRVTAKASPDEIATISRTGCLIIPTISVDQIRPYQP